MLVDQRRIHADVSHSTHQLAKTSARHGREVVARVAHIVDVDIGHLGLRQRPSPHFGEVRPQWCGPLGANEYATVVAGLCILLEVPFESSQI